MSYQTGPRIVTNGLVFCVDAADANSYAGSGTTWNDLSGNGNNGTLTNGPTFSSANRGSIVFDGTNDYTDINNTIANNLLSSLTFNLWVSLNTTSDVGLFSNFNSASNFPGFVFRTSTTSIAIYYFHNGSNYIGRTASISANTNVWYNLTGTWNGTINNSGFAIYLNGTKVDNANGSGGTVSSIINGGANLEIGRERFFAGPALYLNGKISACQIYNRVISATEILQNYNATKGRYGF